MGKVNSSKVIGTKGFLNLWHSKIKLDHFVELHLLKIFSFQIALRPF